VGSARTRPSHPSCHVPRFRLTLSAKWVAGVFGIQAPDFAAEMVAGTPFNMAVPSGIGHGEPSGASGSPAWTEMRRPLMIQVSSNLNRLSPGEIHGSTERMAFANSRASNGLCTKHLTPAGRRFRFASILKLPKSG